jgi:hypothetical protein
MCRLAHASGIDVGYRCTVVHVNTQDNHWFLFLFEHAGVLAYVLLYCVHLAISHVVHMFGRIVIYSCDRS